MLIVKKIEVKEKDVFSGNVITGHKNKLVKISGGELPDIDTDFEAAYRDTVKKYIEQKYGNSYFCSIGTYTNFKFKILFKDVCKMIGIPFSQANFFTSIISNDVDSTDFTDIVRYIIQEPKLKAFIKINPKILLYLELMLMSPRSNSIHASATIIIPEEINGEKVSIFDMIPVKKINDDSKELNGSLVSEWEGKQIEKAGFLKEDILGLLQLDKIKKTLTLIKKNRNIDIDIYNINLKDKKVFKHFHNGLNEDVFQFGTAGLKEYSSKLKPDSISDLSAANALYRPGPMESNAHMDFVEIKFGRKKVEYDPLLEDVLKDTYGLYCYQEQVMKAFQIISNATLAQADDFRKFITKIKGDYNKDERYLKYKSLFIEGYLEKGVKQDVSIKVWDKIIAFAGYAFNKSHAVCYAILGYITQYLKVHYPLEFWASSLNSTAMDKLPNRIFEINKSKNIKLKQPDVNVSSDIFEYDLSNNFLFWSISSIKGLGVVAVESIIKARDEEGGFSSFNHFYDLIKDKKIKVNKNSVLSMIICGCFDLLEDVKKPKDRLKIMKKYSLLYLEEIDQKFLSPEFNKDYKWQLEAKERCGYGPIDYLKYLDDDDLEDYIDLQGIETKSGLDSSHTFIGIIHEVIERKGKNAKYFGQVTVDHNDMHIVFIIWSDHYEKIKNELINNKMIKFNAELKGDKYRNLPTFYSTPRTKITIK